MSPILPDATAGPILLQLKPPTNPEFIGDVTCSEAFSFFYIGPLVGLVLG